MKKMTVSGGQAKKQGKQEAKNFSLFSRTMIFLAPVVLVTFAGDEFAENQYFDFAMGFIRNLMNFEEM
jgi:hypothetical protein